MTKIRISDPAVNPVSLIDAKSHLRVDISDDDDLITELIGAATQQVESVTGLALIRQTWRLYRDTWPANLMIELGPTPILSVDNVVVYDADGSPSSLAAANYVVDRHSQPARLQIIGSITGPGVAINGIEVDFTAGYGSAGDDVPPPLRQAILMLVAHWYEHREAVAAAGGAPVPKGLEALIAPYREPRL